MHVKQTLYNVSVFIIFHLGKEERRADWRGESIVITVVVISWTDNSYNKILQCACASNSSLSNAQMQKESFSYSLRLVSSFCEYKSNCMLKGQHRFKQKHTFLCHFFPSHSANKKTREACLHSKRKLIWCSVVVWKEARQLKKGICRMYTIGLMFANPRALNTDLHLYNAGFGCIMLGPHNECTTFSKERL